MNTFLPKVRTTKRLMVWGNALCKPSDRVGRPPEITGSGIRKKKMDRFEPWKEAEERPTDVQKTTMMKEAMRVALTVIMKNHTYEFNQEIKRQLEGGPIGMDLTGTVAKIFMKWWDAQLIQKMN